MSMHWTVAETASPIVEFADVRVEPGRRLDAEALAFAANPATLGVFRVRGSDNRLIRISGYASPAQRRVQLEAWYRGSQWSSLRERWTGLVRDEQVYLMRAVSPAAGISPETAFIGSVNLALFVSELRFPEQVGTYHLLTRLLLRKAGMDPLAAFATLEMENDVPAVPVRRYRHEHIALVPDSGARPDLPPEVRGMHRTMPEWLALEPVSLPLAATA
jgi:hypothetical protein